MNYDAILIHPPAVYDFRKKAMFPGPIAYTVRDSTEQFMIPPVGMLSIADYLDRNGYRVIVDNLCERMVKSEDFDAEEHIKRLSAKIYAVGLHWCVHSQGAIEIARLCKKLHPEAMVVLGGLTATVFSEEIIRKYEFVDAVIRGEAEKPFLSLMKALEQQKKLGEVPNLIVRDDGGEIRSAPLMKPSIDLDEFEYTRFDLIEPRMSIFNPYLEPHWGIPICRGCLYNCVTCGGSAYSYKTYLGRDRPAFRSPEKIAEDIKKLNKQGVQSVFLFQDPRMGGRKYWSLLLTTLRSENIKLNHLIMELFGPAKEEYIRELSKIGIPVSLTISPESLIDRVRRANGRNYTNEELFRTVKLCKKYNIQIGIYSMIALPKDTLKTIKETWGIWEKICSTNLRSQSKASIAFAFGPMILLDPGSLAFDFPRSYGYRLIFKSLDDYIKGMSLPSWHQWISYETKYLNRDLIAELIINSIEYSINLRERYGLYSSQEASRARSYLVEDSKKIIEMTNSILSLQNEGKNSKKKRWNL